MPPSHSPPLPGKPLNPRQERLLRQLGRMPAGPPEAVAPVADGTLHHQVA